MPQWNQITDEGKFLFIEVLQLISEGMIELDCCHFAAPKELMDLGTEHTQLITAHSILCFLMEGHHAACEMFWSKNQTWIWLSL